jgi:hypothetical protein
LDCIAAQGGSTTCPHKLRYWVNHSRELVALAYLWIGNQQFWYTTTKGSWCYQQIYPVCYYFIIGYLLTFNTRSVFSSFYIFGYGDMFRYQHTILRPISQMFANNLRTK